MKIQCIDNRDSPFLTLNKKYELIRKEYGYYIIIDDINTEAGYSKDRFKIVKKDNNGSKF
jgi:hypothetical protein